MKSNTKRFRLFCMYEIYLFFQSVLNSQPKIERGREREREREKLVPAKQKQIVLTARDERALAVLCVRDCSACPFPLFCATSCVPPLLLESVLIYIYIYIYVYIMRIKIVKGLIFTCGGNYRKLHVRTLNEKTRQDKYFLQQIWFVKNKKKGKTDKGIVFANFVVICGELYSESGWQSWKISRDVEVFFSRRLLLFSRQ